MTKYIFLMAHYIAGCQHWWDLAVPIYLIDPQTPILISGLVRGCISLPSFSVSLQLHSVQLLCALVGLWIREYTWRKATQTAGLSSLGAFLLSGILTPQGPSYLNIYELQFLSSLPCQAPLPSNSCLLTFSTSPSPLLKIGKCLGESWQLGASQSVSLFLQDLGHSNPTTVFFSFFQTDF